MRKAIAAFALVALAAVFMLTTASTADAAKRKTVTKTGTITSVSDKTFVCEWKKVKYTYKVTDKTTFRDQGKSGTFADVKVGSVVNIGYHYAGKDRVADWVTIEKRQ
jgi:hypothetical protein